VDIIVVGGGAVGLAVAWRATTAGHRVRVVDPAPGRGASWAAAGMLAPVTEAHYGEEPLLGLNLASAQRWPDFAAELADAAGRDPGYRTAGTITVARDLDDKAALAELHTFQQRLGLSVERLSGTQIRALEPTLAPRVRGGLSAPDDHQVDNRALVEALLAACTNAGVTIDPRPALRIAIEGDGVRGVAMDGEILGADAVVLAAGVATAGLAGLPPGVVPPVRPVKGQLLHLRGAPEAAPQVGAVRGLEVYIVSRGDGRLVVGATMEERSDTGVTAGGVRELLRAAWELLPGIDEFALVETTAGLRPATPDNAPVLGPTAIGRLHLATGHFRNGILLTPITAETVVAALDGAVPEIIAPFSAARFDRVGAAS
jgi:glycine oxidase